MWQDAELDSCCFIFKALSEGESVHMWFAIISLPGHISRQVGDNLWMPGIFAAVWRFLAHKLRNQNRSWVTLFRVQGHLLNEASSSVHPACIFSYFWQWLLPRLWWVQVQASSIRTNRNSLGTSMKLSGWEKWCIMCLDNLKCCPMIEI